MQHLSTTKGFGLVEVLVSAALIAAAAAGMFGAFVLFVHDGLANAGAVQATYFAEAGVEGVRSIRDRDWDDLAGVTPGATYYLHWQADGWHLQTNATSSDGFIRRVHVFEVWRDNEDRIVASTSPSASYNDPDSREVDVTVAWGVPTTTRTITTVLTNIHGN